MGVRTVIDLRRPPEVLAHPDAIATNADFFEYQHAPFYEIGRGPDSFSSTEEMFRYRLDSCGKGIGRGLRLLAESGPGTLVHCTNGNHRAGLITALALSVAGVPHEMVASDFALSAKYLAPRNQELLEVMAERGWDPIKMAWFLESRAETMLETLGHLDARYGGVGPYLAGIGVSDGVQDSIRAWLVG